MSFVRSAFFALFLLLASPALAQNGEGDWLYRGSDIPRDPAWRFGTLANGIHYAVRRNALPAGQVSIRVRVDVGSLNEQDGERGWAHFIEHMLFRGTETYPDRRAREIWQQLGASFGSDTNASTDATNTVYTLNLPHATREPLDTSLAVLAEMMARARLDPAAIDAERPVVLAEKGRRPELAVRYQAVSQPLLYAGLRFADRDPIGTDATLNAADAAGLRAFYRRWYRPERTTIVMVGDADPAMMEALIRARFGGWHGEGPAPAELDDGRVAAPSSPVASLAYPGSPVSIDLAWVRPHDPAPHTLAREENLVAEQLAAMILNRRLEAHARGQSAYLNAAVAVVRARRIADATTLAVVARGDDWRAALAEAYGIVGDAVRTPPSDAEIQRELSNLRVAVAASVEGEATAPSAGLADRLVNAVDNGVVVASARTVLDGFERGAPHMTPARIGAATRALFAGSGPRMLLLTPSEVAGGAAALAAGLAAAEAATPAVRAAERAVSFADLPRPGPPGREASRQHLDDLDVTIVRFANGATLTFKHSDFERGSVGVQLRFGSGRAAMAPDRASFGWLSGLIGPSGLADFDLEATERLLTGRRLNIAFATGEDSFALAGQTDAAELGDELVLLTAKLTHPRWDAALLERFRSAAVSTFDLNRSSASARARRELGGVLRPNDQRWRPAEQSEIAAVTLADLRDYFTPLLGAGPVHAVIVGDVDLATAVEAARRTVGALPARPPVALPPGWDRVAPPAPNPAPRTFTHRGDPDQAYALIGWSTFGGEGRPRERRALALAANMFKARLFDRLREQEGTTYSPEALSLGADAYPRWGVFYAAAEVRPANVPAFFRAAREIVADLAARPAAPDEFARAQNPVLSGIERRIATNGYWLDAIGDFDHDPQAIANVRSYLADYRALTAEDVRRAVATYVTDQGDWSMLVLPERPAPARP